jgi:hypothetical protein
MSLSFTIAAGPRQRSHSQVRFLRDSWPYFTVSDSIHPQPGGPGPRIYIPPEQAGPVIPPSTVFPFRRLLRLAGLQLRYSNPPPVVLLLTPRHEPPQKTPFPTVPPLLCVYSLLRRSVFCDCYLATALVYFFISRSLHSNDSTSYNINIRNFNNTYIKFTYLLF